MVSSEIRSGQLCERIMEVVWRLNGRDKDDRLGAHGGVVSGHVGVVVQGMWEWLNKPCGMHTSRIELK